MIVKSILQSSFNNQTFIKYLQCYRASLRIYIHVPRKDVKLDNKCLLHLHFTMGENKQLYGTCTFLSIPEEEGPVHRLSNVCIEWRKDLSAVRAKDDPGNLSKGKNKFKS